MQNSSLYETHVYTVDLKRAVNFYQNLGLKISYVLEDRRAAFFEVGEAGKKEQMLGVWETAPDKLTRSHFAFAVSYDQLLRVPKFLQNIGVELKESFGLKPLEPVVHCWMPAASFYFEDYDGNTLEYITVLDEKPQPVLGVIYLSEWKKRQLAEAKH